MLADVRSAAVLGIDAYDVLVEVDVALGLPMWTIVGLPAGAVKESRERVSAALLNSGFVVPARRVTVNLGGAVIAYSGAMQGADCTYDYYSGSECDAPNDTMVAIGAGVSVMAWVISLVDAHSAARRYNEKWGLTRQVGVHPMIAPTRNGQTALGLSVAPGALTRRAMTGQS